MIEVDVIGVQLELPHRQPVVLLRERDGARVVPIWIGAPEAAAITLAMEGMSPGRPLTHDLLLDVVRAMGRALESVRVTDLSDNVFHAELVLTPDERIDCRASDAIALAVRADVPVLVADSVLEQAGIEVADETDDEVERFKEFLDHVSPEDFEGDTGDDPQHGPESE